MLTSPPALSTLPEAENDVNEIWRVIFPAWRAEGSAWKQAKIQGGSKIGGVRWVFAA